MILIENTGLFFFLKICMIEKLIDFEKLIRECSLLYICKGKYHFTVNLLKTVLYMAVVDINKKFLYNPFRPAFWEVDGMYYNIIKE